MRTFSQEEVDRYARELQYEADAEAARRAQRANGPDVDVKPGGEKAAEQFYTAGDLQWMEFPPLRFIVPGYLVEGLTILVGKPKRGKSWMALDWVLAIAHGGTLSAPFNVMLGIASTWHWRTAREGCNAASGSFYRIPLNGRRA
jgi:hypothetical protein